MAPARVFGRVFVLALGLLGSFAVVEVTLRIAGYEPWKYRGVDSGEPTVHEPDPVLGWTMKAGTHVFPPYSHGAAPVTLTVLADGSRSAGPRPALAPRAEIVFVGCSVTHGWGISDPETFAWKVQQRLPDVHVRNFGTAAYGTFQSLLVLESLFASEDPPEHVLYGFIDHHEARNVALPNWLMGLSLFSHRGHVATPYCTLDAEGALERRPPESYPSWPLRERLALVRLLEFQYVKLGAAPRARSATHVTELLLAEMNELCRKHGARFTVILIQFKGENRPEYARFLNERGIDFIDCERPITPDLEVPGEGHPNGEMNSIWADCIVAGLSRTS